MTPNRNIEPQAWMTDGDLGAVFAALQATGDPVPAVLSVGGCVRDALRGVNASRRQQRGLVSSEELLIDYEKRRLDLIAKKEQALQLQNRFEQLVNQTNQLKGAISAAGGVV